MQIIIGNVIMLVASVIMVASGLVKDKKKLLAAQTIQIIIAAIGNGVLGSYSGMTSNLLSGIRNILEYKKKLTNFIKLIIVVALILLTICFNDIGIMGWLPTVSCIIFTIFVTTENIIVLKNVIIFCNTLWMIHDGYIAAYTAMIFDILYILANIISIIKIKKASTSK